MQQFFAPFFSRFMNCKKKQRQSLFKFIAASKLELDIWILVLHSLGHCKDVTIAHIRFSSCVRPPKKKVKQQIITHHIVNIFLHGEYETEKN